MEQDSDDEDSRAAPPKEPPVKEKLPPPPPPPPSGMPQPPPLPPQPDQVIIRKDYNPKGQQPCFFLTHILCDAASNGNLTLIYVFGCESPACRSLPKERSTIDI